MASTENTPEMSKTGVREVAVHDDSQEETTSTRQPPTLDLPPPPDSSRLELNVTAGQHVKTSDDKEKITRPTSIELKQPDAHGQMHKVDQECSLRYDANHFDKKTLGKDRNNDA
jgi:hypothetical protein